MTLNLNGADHLSAYLNTATKPELRDLIRYFSAEASQADRTLLTVYANELRERYYQKKVYFRGLLEFSSYCKNDCSYCGLGHSNGKAVRYRLTEADILDSCANGYARGFRTFVLQSGEDAYFTDARLCRMIELIKAEFCDCAVTLSVGERSRASYQALFDAGADRYLLRHETADETHYGKLHPPEQTLKDRIRCLYDLKEIGYQVGAGFMVGSPFQTDETLAEDFIFLRQLQPHMIGIGPFIPQKDTRFRAYAASPVEQTLILLSLIRVMLPKVLLPATTALGTIDHHGREKGLCAGANVLMPNLTPAARRGDYALYDHKLCTGKEAAEGFSDLLRSIRDAGFTPDLSRGDYIDFQRETPADTREKK